MKYSIIGTAGHIDHGKSSLIKALNGFWGDESKEEKRRGITIDLSFSYLKSDEKTLAFIDVPGHEKLTSTMISGAFSFDACLLVIDASEGIMPQTKEHLEVLNFLHVKTCIVALSKCDLSDEKTITHQEQNIKDEFKKYPNLELHELVQTSINDENSIEKLKAILFALPQKQRKSENEVFRYYIDRVFNVKGFGTVSTGTILNGQIALNDKIWISQLEKFTQIKSIQIHNKPSESAHAHQRVALNLSKLKSDELKRGMLLTQKGYIRGFKNIDIFLECKEGKSLPHNQEVILHLGSEKINGTLLHINTEDEFKKGITTFVSSEDDIYCIYEDKCIISANGDIVAGGFVVNPINDPIKKKNKIPILKNLASRNFKEAFLALCHIHKKGFGLISAYQRFNLSHEQILDILKDVEGIFLDKKALVAYPSEMIQETEKIVEDIFKKNPYALISDKSLNLKHKWLSQNLALKAIQNLQEQKKIIFTNGVWAKAGINPKSLEENVQNKIYSIITEGGVSPLAPYNIYDMLDLDRRSGDNAMRSLTKSQKVVRLEHNFFVNNQVLTEVMKQCRQIIKEEGYVDIKNLKDRLKLSRKYLIAYLEYLDMFEDISKQGTKRVVRGLK